MTVALFGLGALAAAAGTRAAGFLFLGAAVLGASGSMLPALVTWTAAMAAGLTFIRGTPRRLAIPAVGAAAAVGAGSARNTAVVLGLWVLATGAAVLSRGKGPEADRWAQTLCAADIPVVVAVAWSAFDTGFEGWPQQLDAVAVALLVIAAVLRVPLISGPDDDSQEAGLLAVRAQTIVLLLLAVGSPAGDDLLSAAALLGALGFLAGGTVKRAATRDSIQEIGLVAVVLAAAQAGWGPVAWQWGALAAGTLIHNLRLTLGEERAGPLAGFLHQGGGVGLPLLPVVVVALEGATGADGWIGSAMMLGLVGGLATRASAPWQARPEPKSKGRRPVWEPGLAGAIVAGCAIGGLWAPVLTVPNTIAGEGIGWPPAWAAVAVLVAGAAAGFVLRAEGPAEGSLPSRPRPWQPLALPDVRLPARLARPRMLAASMGALGLFALVMWVVGVLRGFL